MTRLKNKVAIVTGAATGIGAATAKLFAQEGAKVVIADIRGEIAQETAAAIQAAGGDAIAITTDVTQADQVEALVEKTIDTYGAIDILHCNAGVMIAGSVDDMPEDAWHKTLGVNVIGTFLCGKYAVPHMKQRRSGSIIITSSTSGLLGEVGLAAYNTSKGALVNLTRQMAIDYAKQGIRVNGVAPGWIDTPFNNPIYDSTGVDKAEATAAIPMQRQGTPEEVAYAVLFLASDEASYITGHTLVVDGGVYAQ